MRETLLVPLIEGVVAGLIVAALFLFLYIRTQKKAATGVLANARAEAERIRAAATESVELARQEAVVSTRLDAVKAREELEKELQPRREEVARIERRADERSRAADRRQEELDGQQRELARKVQAVEARDRALAQREADAARAAEAQQAALERIAGLSRDDARRELLQRVEDEARSAAQALARDIKEQARKGAERDARRIVAMAAQRIAAEHTAETTVSAVTLPSDEMKGRIIGREGRNIRAFETVTGVDVIIDDTPDTVVISCFDPIRREVARRALEQLITDGRIHPGRIEELVAKVRRELDQQLVDAGGVAGARQDGRRLRQRPGEGGEQLDFARCARQGGPAHLGVDAPGRRHAPFGRALRGGNGSRVVLVADAADCQQRAWCRVAWGG